MGAACNLQMYAISNINQTFTTGFTYSNKIFIYIDASADENVFPAWVKPGGLFTINLTRAKTVSGIEMFDRIYAPGDYDACNPATLSGILSNIKNNYSNNGGTLSGNNVRLIMWGHGDGIIPLSGLSLNKTKNINYEDIALDIMLLPLGLFESCSMHPGGETAVSVSKPSNYGRHSYNSFLYNNSTQLTLSDSAIVTAIQNSFGYVGTLGFDTCYSGNLEDMYAFARGMGYNGIIIGSPGTEANLGWNYSGYLSGTWIYGVEHSGDAISAANNGVNLIQTFANWFNVYTGNELIPDIISSYYTSLIPNAADMAFYITNSRKYINPANGSDPADHYVRLYDLLNDLQNFDVNFSSLFSGYLSKAVNQQEFATNMGVWLPVFPKQYYNPNVTAWHSSTAIQLFQDYPKIADLFTNAKWGQTQNSVFMFTPQLYPGYYYWCTLSGESGGSATVSGGYYAYIVDQRNENQTPASAIGISPAIYTRTNVAFIAGEGQVDYYALNVLTAGYVHLRLSFTAPSAGNPAVSNVQLLDGSQNVLQSYSECLAGFRNVSPPAAALSTIAYGGQSSIGVSSTTNEYNNMYYIEIDTNLSAGTYYIRVSAQDLMTSYYGPADAPYLIYALPLGGESPAAVLL